MVEARGDQLRPLCRGSPSVGARFAWARFQKCGFGILAHAAPLGAISVPQMFKWH
jgi:hypothetical protein